MGHCLKNLLGVPDLRGAGHRRLALLDAERLDWPVLRDAAAGCRPGFAGDAARNCRRSVAGMDCLWVTSVWVQESRRPCGDHLENRKEKTRCEHHISTCSIPTCTRTQPPGHAGSEDASKKKSCGESRKQAALGNTLAESLTQTLPISSDFHEDEQADLLTQFHPSQESLRPPRWRAKTPGHQLSRIFPAKESSVRLKSLEPLMRFVTTLQAWITVPWSRPPNSSPIWTSGSLVRLRTRNIAT